MRAHSTLYLVRLHAVEYTNTFARLEPNGIKDMCVVRRLSRHQHTIYHILYRCSMSDSHTTDRTRHICLLHMLDSMRFRNRNCFFFSFSSPFSVSATTRRPTDKREITSKSLLVWHSFYSFRAKIFCFTRHLSPIFCFATDIHITTIDWIDWHSLNLSHLYDGECAVVCRVFKSQPQQSENRPNGARQKKNK